MNMKPIDVKNLTDIESFARQYLVDTYINLAPLEGQGKVEVVVRVEFVAHGYAYARYIDPRMIADAKDPWEAIANECRLMAEKVIELAATGDA